MKKLLVNSIVILVLISLFIVSCKPEGIPQPPPPDRGTGSEDLAGAAFGAIPEPTSIDYVYSTIDDLTFTPVGSSDTQLAGRVLLAAVPLVPPMEIGFRIVSVDGYIYTGKSTDLDFNQYNPGWKRLALTGNPAWQSSVFWMNNTYISGLPPAGNDVYIDIDLTQTDFDPAVATTVVVFPTLTYLGDQYGAPVDMGEEIPLPWGGGAGLLCGNSQVDTGEECDGTILPLTECSSFKPIFSGGTLTCNSSCKYDATACTVKNIVFNAGITSSGNIGGLSAADSKCNEAAAAAGLPGTYAAWLSDSTTSAASRVLNSDQPYYLPDGTTKVANSMSSLLLGTILNKINKFASGENSNIPYIWTNTKPDGTAYSTSNTCNNWASTTGEARYGRTYYDDDRWTSENDMQCSYFASFYCFPAGAGVTTDCRIIGCIQTLVCDTSTGQCVAGPGGTTTNDVSCSFTATVTTVNDPAGHLSSITTGSQISGTFSYDSSLPDSGGGSLTGDYSFTSPYKLESTVNSMTFSTNPSNVDLRIIVTNGAPGSMDRFQVNTPVDKAVFSPSSILPSGWKVFGLRFHLNDNLGTAVTSTALPTDLDLSDWQDKTGEYGYLISLYKYPYTTSGNLIEINSDITSMQCTGGTGGDPSSCVTTECFLPFVCDTSSGLCVECLTASDCDSGEICQSNECVEDTGGDQCTEEGDTGIDYYNQGKVKDSYDSDWYEDTCTLAGVDIDGPCIDTVQNCGIKERYCSSNNRRATHYISGTTFDSECPYGCEDGACIEAPTDECTEASCTGGIKECTDPDGGNKPKIAGKTNGLSPIDDSMKNRPDVCYGSTNKIVEYYCDTSKPGYYTYYAPPVQCPADAPKCVPSISGSYCAPITCPSSCSPPTPHCDVVTTGGLCAECRDGNDCSAGYSCTNNVCVEDVVGQCTEASCGECKDTVADGSDGGHKPKIAGVTKGFSAADDPPFSRTKPDLCVGLTDSIIEYSCDVSKPGYYAFNIVGCPADAPYCKSSDIAGEGAICVVTKCPSSCPPPAPYCDDTTTGGLCAECRDDNDCGTNEECISNACEEEQQLIPYWTLPAGSAGCNAGFAITSWDCGGNCKNNMQRVRCSPLPSGVVLGSPTPSVAGQDPSCGSGKVAVGYDCSSVCDGGSWNLLCATVGGGTLSSTALWTSSTSYNNDCITKGNDYYLTAINRANDKNDLKVGCKRIT
ncbi:DUF1554 domain-containing protein [Thermoproteota archaeon]